MARYENTLNTSLSKAEAEDKIRTYLESEGFQLTRYENKEDVWKKGSGLLTAPQYLKAEVGEGQVRLEAWIKFALLPGVYMGEFGIHGAFLLVPKRLLKKRVDALEAMFA